VDERNGEEKEDLGALRRDTLSPAAFAGLAARLTPEAASRAVEALGERMEFLVDYDGEARRETERVAAVMETYRCMATVELVSRGFVQHAYNLLTRGLRREDADALLAALAVAIEEKELGE
jgi:hypothetical protein